MCIHKHPRTCPVLSNRVCCDRARRAKSEELSLLDIWASHHSSEASFRVAGQSWLLPRGVLEPMTFEGLGVSTLSTLTDRLKLTWALPQALIRPILFAAQMNCQNLFLHQLITRPFDCAVLWLSAQIMTLGSINSFLLLFPFEHLQLSACLSNSLQRDRSRTSTCCRLRG